MSGAIASECVRAQLEKVLSSSRFSRSERLRRFLRYLVEVALSGRLELLRELPLGMDVFERGMDFDPRVDPIVRIDARRLRARLSEYYEGEGAFDEVEIGLERGGYVPSFRRRKHLRSTAGVEVREWRVGVLPFESWSAAPDERLFGRVLTEELVSALGQVAGWRIVVCSGEAAQRGLGEDAATIVRGAILRSGATFRVTVNIVSAPDGCLLASQRFDRHENDGYELQQEVIRYVLARLIGAANPTSDDSEGFHRYLQGRYLMNQGTPEALQKAVRCFQQIVEREAHSSRAWAGLAAALNTMLLLGAADPAVAVPQAERAAAKALEGEPDLPEAKTAHAMAMVLSGDTIANARRTLESVIQAHPHFVPARIAYAAHCLLPSGDVASAKQQVEIAIGADPSNPSALYLLSLVQYAELQYDEARQTLEAILRISPDYPACWLQLAEIHRRAGNGREALTAYDRFEKLSPAPRAARIISNAAAESGAPDSPLAATGLPRRRAAGSTVGF